MKNKRMTAAVAVMAVLAAAAGCGAAEPESTEVPVINVDDAEQSQEGDEPEEGVSAEENMLQEGAQTDGVAQSEEDGQADEREQDYLPGKVREINDDSVIISKTFLERDEQGFGSQVYIPEKGSADEELVTVRYTDDAEFEHWTIKGGGAEIDRREASFSDITEDAGLEMYGYYEGDVFIAQRVIIEIDV